MAIYGPLSIEFVEKLKELLEQEGGKYKIFQSEEDLESHRQSIKDEGVQIYPTYHSSGNFLYIEIETQYLLIVKAELEKMIGPLKSVEHDELVELPEYLCPKCKYIQDTPGFCPTHQLRLLEFSDWVIAKRKRQARTEKIVAGIVLIGMLVAYLATRGL